MYKHGAGTERAYRSAAIHAKIRYNRAFAKGVVSTPKKIKRAAGRSWVVPRLTEEDPPGAEHGTCKDKDGPHDDNNNKRLSNCSIESAQGSSRPIYPGCGVIR